MAFPAHCDGVSTAMTGSDVEISIPTGTKAFIFTASGAATTLKESSGGTAFMVLADGEKFAMQDPNWANCSFFANAASGNLLALYVKGLAC